MHIFAQEVHSGPKTRPTCCSYSRGWLGRCTHARFSHGLQTAPSLEQRDPAYIREVLICDESIDRLLPIDVSFAVVVRNGAWYIWFTT